MNHATLQQVAVAPEQQVDTTSSRLGRADISALARGDPIRPVTWPIIAGALVLLIGITQVTHHGPGSRSMS